jgi:hypothetical protein
MVFIILRQQMNVVLRTKSFNVKQPFRYNHVHCKFLALIKLRAIENFYHATSNLLCDIECQFEVASSIFRIQFRVVECVRIEMMDQSTKCHSISPAAAEVGNVDMLHDTVFYRVKVYHTTRH